MAGNLDKLHEEEIRMILQYVKNKNALYLTCRRLNELCLQIDNKTKDIELIISGTEALKDSAVSIINSKRIITSLVIKLIHQRELLFTVLKKIGPNVKRIIMEDCNMLDLCICLNFVPNIQKLILFNLTFEEMLSLSFSLKKLKKLEILYCHPRISQVLCGFPENVLEELVILEAFAPIELYVAAQRNLKALNITTVGIRSYLINFKDLKLESFESQDSENLIPFLESQPQLKKLTLSGTSIDNDTFRCVTQFKLLSNLKINVQGVSRFAISELNRLTKLKSLEIINTNTYADYQGEITELSRMQFDELAVLIITFPYLEVPSSDLIEIAANFKNLSMLDITLKVVTNDHIRPFMTKVKAMRIKFYLDDMKDDFFGDFNHYDINVQNLNLEELHLRGMKLKFEDLPLIIKNFPNMKNLVLRFDGSVIDEHVEQILIGMPKLQILELRRCCRLTIKIVDIIKEHGKNLNKISVSGIEDFTKIQFDQAFRDYPQDIDFYSNL